MTADERRRLFEHLQEERLKGLEAWQRLFDRRSTSEDGTVQPLGRSTHATHPFRTRFTRRVQRDSELAVPKRR